jgi:hypothetical protein
MPKKAGKEGSLDHPAYGDGEYAYQEKLEHADIAGWAKLQQRGQSDFNNLTARSTSSKNNGYPSMPSGGACTGENQFNGYFLAEPRPAQGEGYYASPVNKRLEGVAGVHFGTRNGGVSDAKYLPTHVEAVLGYNAAVPDYGDAKFASPVKAQVHARYGEGHPWKERRDLDGCGAYVTPRSGIY